MITAEDIMQREIICVSPEMEIQEVAGLFREKMISGAPVVDEAGHLLGLYLLPIWLTTWLNQLKAEWSY